jgi:dienelactone hydrolase
MRLLASLLLVLGWALSAHAQQAVRVKPDLPAQLYRPAVMPAPAMAIFHGCGGVGANNTRMAELLKSWGYVALVADSFTGRGLKDVCGRNWPTQADAEKRALDIDAAGEWLASQPFVKANELAFMGYSYGGGVGLLRALSSSTDKVGSGGWRAAILVYPDCGLGEAIGPALRVRLPTMMAMGELDDWTPVNQCQALLERVMASRDLIETHVYPGAHHSFDALGLPVRYLEGVGNRSKPGGCCGAHYGANETAWKRFVEDVKTFLGRTLEPARR